MRLGRRRARARRARRLARPGGDEGRRLASHVVQLRRHQRAGVDPRARGRASSASPSIVTRLQRATTRWSTSRSACTNRAGPRTIAVRGTLAGDRAALPAGPARPRRRRHRPRPGAHRSAPTCGSPATRRSRSCAWRSPASRVFTASVGLRELRWAGGRLPLNGQPLKLRGASLQEDAPGRGDALTDADADAIVARLKAIGANATRSQHPLAEALLDRLDAAGILVWQGVGPVDAPGRLDLAHAGAAAPRDPPRAPERPAGAPAPQRRGLEPRQRGRRQRPRRRPARVRRRGRAARAPPRPRPPDRRRRVGHAHARPRRASSTATSTPSAPPTTRAGTTTRSRPPATVQAGIDAWLARLRATFPGKVLIVSEFGAEANRLNAPGAPGSRELPGEPAPPPHPRPTGRPRGSTACWSGTCRTSRSRPSFAGGSIRRRCPDIHLVRGLNQKGLFAYGGRPSRRSRRCGGRSPRLR